MEKSFIEEKSHAKGLLQFVWPEQNRYAPKPSPSIMEDHIVAMKVRSTFSKRKYFASKSSLMLPTVSKRHMYT